MSFKVGEKVQHILSKDYLLVLEVDTEKETYVCRTKDLREIKLQAFEVEPINRR